jgi:DNA recombination protein RmuC
MWLRPTPALRSSALVVAVVLITIVAAAGLAALIVVLARTGRTLVDERLGGIEQRLDRRLGELDERVDRRLEGIDGRLLSTQQSTGETTTKIVERLTKLDGATEQMLQQAGQISRLEHVLRPPKARGGFGELLLENLLRDRLPPSAYEIQYGFKSGERVDAVIRVERLIPVDAKFPLDNFQRMVEAEDDASRALHEKAFARDMKGHVDAIAEKYIKPAEGTYDFAFMYLPAEAIYYELVSGKTGALLDHAHSRRVFPTSATTFTAYLQVIAFGLKGMEFEQNAHEVMAYVADLRNDFLKMRADFELVGKHLSNAQTKYIDSEKRFDKFDGKLERASEQEALDTPIAAPQLEAVDAA